MTMPAFRLEAAGREVKLGRLSPTPDMLTKCVPLGAYVKRYGGKPPPDQVTYHTKATKSLAEMLGNDQYGDCVIAAELHGVGLWTANEPGGREVVANTQEAVSQYRRICGPGDNGCYIPRVLDYFRDQGLTANGKLRKIDGYVRVDPRDELLVKIATHLFGRLHLGINWPRDWMTDARPGGVLRPTTSPIVGGHAVVVGGYNAEGLQIGTWGFLCTLSWDALRDPRFVDECYAPLGEDWYNEQGETAAGIGVNVAKLREDLKVIQGGGIPDIPDDVDPTPPPPPPVDPSALWEWLKDFDILGFTVHLHAAIRRKTAQGLYAPSWWTVAMLAWDIVKLVRAGDWSGLLTAVPALVNALLDLLDVDTMPRLHEFLVGVNRALAPVGKSTGAKSVDGGAKSG